MTLLMKNNKTKTPYEPLDFSFDLLRQVGPRGQNVFFSPFSISACMALLYDGARGAGIRCDGLAPRAVARIT
jgi:serine protease inhibitor